MTSRASRSSIVLFASLLLPGCFIELDGDLEGAIRGHIDASCWDDGSTSSERLDVEQEITAVVVDGGVGDIRVRTHESSGAVIDAVVYGDDTEPRIRVEGTVLHVDVDCGGADCCAADLDLTIPAAAGLEVDLGVGDVSVDGVGGDTRIDLGTGDVDLRRLSGSVELSTSTGSIEGDELHSAELRADVDIGDVDLQWSDSAVIDAARVDIGVGSADLEVPAGEYELYLDVGVGDIDTDGIRGADGATGSITVDIGTGDIDVDGR